MIVPEGWLSDSDDKYETIGGDFEDPITQTAGLPGW